MGDAEGCPTTLCSNSDNNSKYSKVRRIGVSECRLAGLGGGAPPMRSSATRHSLLPRVFLFGVETTSRGAAPGS